jgi:subtilisin family serine protease
MSPQDTARADTFPDQRILILPLQEQVTRAGFDSTYADLRADPAVEFVGTVVLVEPGNTPMVLTDEIVVKFIEGVPQDSVNELYSRYNLEVVRGSEARPGRFVLRVADGSARNVLDAANALYESGLVEYAHPNFYAKTVRRSSAQPFFPNDPRFNDQWHLNNTGQNGGSVDADIDAPEAWDHALGAANIIIAVLDDGIQWNHPDLTGNVVAGGRDFTANPPDNDPSPGGADNDNHGTTASGVAAAVGNNNVGVSGVCPECGLLPIRMFGGSLIDHADAFDYVANTAWVISNSWGYDIGVPATDDVVDAINNASVNGRGGLGAVVLFAMTNLNVDNCVQPTPDISALANVIAVSRSNRWDQIDGAGFGPCMDVIAPGRDIWTTDRTGNNGYVNGDYVAKLGTSYSTPLTAGIAGLLLDINPNLTREQVQAIIEETAEKIDAANANYDANGFSNTAGHGRVNAHRAVVPTVKISVSPTVVDKGEPFSVTLTASAPHGLAALWWFGQGTGIPHIDQAHWHNVAGGEPVYTQTWSAVTIDSKGTYTLAANARDVLYPNPGDGYPHQASEGSGIPETTIEVVPDVSILGLVSLMLMVIAVTLYRRRDPARA